MCTMYTFAFLNLAAANEPLIQCTISSLDALSSL